MMFSFFLLGYLLANVPHANLVWQGVATSPSLDVGGWSARGTFSLRDWRFVRADKVEAT